MNNRIVHGIDAILAEDSLHPLRSGNFVLISGSSVTTGSGLPVFAALRDTFPRTFREVWSLQHGFFVDKQDNMVLSDSFFDPRLNLKVRSFYGNKRVPDRGETGDIEVLLIDIFDVGTRVYTFLNHILLILRELQGSNIRALVADRPNPLGGAAREGFPARKEFFSLVSQIPVPLRHGLTAGEYLRHGCAFHHINIPLQVIPVRGWDRHRLFSGIWTYPSPNMPRFHTALIYPGAVLLEGTNLSEGRGTTRPFEFFGAPFLDNIRLCRQLREKKFPGLTFLPVFFKPEYSKYQGQICRGVMTHVTDPGKVRSVEVFYEAIRIIRREYPEQFSFICEPYEFESGRPVLDWICGTDRIREFLEADLPFRDFSDEIRREIHEFEEQIRPSLLY